MRRWRVILAALSGAAALIALAGAAFVTSLGPAPLGRHLDYSHAVLDRNGRLLRAYATVEGRWRLPATVNDVDPRFLKLLFAYEDKRFRSHHGVDPQALLRAAFQFATSRPHRFGRFDHHDASRAAARAARAPQFRRQIASDRARARARTRARQGRNSLVISGACALWRKPGRDPSGVSCLLWQGAAQALAGGSRAPGRVAAVARIAPARSLCRRRARGARPRARPCRRRRRRAARRDRARQDTKRAACAQGIADAGAAQRRSHRVRRA